MLARNEGNIDRIIRLVLGIVLLVVALTSFSTLWWLAIVGAILVVTGLVGFCPLYRLLGIKTCQDCA
ncbi:MAG: DUF2892 domain-containing protein [Chloroflexi bacterium]|nr:MAG: DUF2892 domain-containing protein [Chloroflexota bacterium]